MIGRQQGLVVVTVLVWCMLFSSAVGGSLKLPLLAGALGEAEVFQRAVLVVWLGMASFLRY
jgi:hypothetical protein